MSTEEIAELKRDVAYIRTAIDQLHNLLLMSRHPHLVWEKRQDGRYMTCKVCGESASYVNTLADPVDIAGDDWVGDKLNCVPK